jgi:hypothetical protein
MVTPNKEVAINKHTQAGIIHLDTTFMVETRETPVRTSNLKGTSTNASLMLSSKSHSITAANHEATDNGIGTRTRVTYLVSVHERKKSKKEPALQHRSLISRYETATRNLEEAAMLQSSPQQFPPPRATSVTAVLTRPNDANTMPLSYLQAAGALR